MKIALGIAALVLVAISFLADYQWKRWMAARQRDRDSGVREEGHSRRDN